MEFVERQDLFGEFERPGDVELLDGRAIVEQRQQLNLGGSQVDQRGLQIGFELHALEFQAVQIDLGDVAGFESLAAYPQQAVVMRQVLGGQRHHRLLLQRLHERIAEVKQQRPLLVRQLRLGDRGALPRALQPQLALAAALAQITGRDQRQSAAQRTVGVGTEGSDLVERRRHVRIGTQIGGDLLGSRLVDADTAGKQSWIGSFETVLDLLPGQRLLR